MLDQIDFIKNFFKLKLNCPVCGNKLTRKLHTIFSDGKKFNYISNPSADMYDYDNLTFIKYKKSITMQHMIDDQAAQYTDASPSAINLIHRTPPSIAYLKCVQAFLECYKNGIEYYIVTNDVERFEPCVERIVFGGKDIYIFPDSITEDVTGMQMTMSKNLILKHTPESAVNLVNKLMIIQ